MSPVVTVALATAAGDEIFVGPERPILWRWTTGCGCWRPGILATWNGAAFDLPFLADRAAACGVTLGLRLAPDPTVTLRHGPLAGHEGAYRASWYAHRHVDGYRMYRGDVGRVLGMSCSLKAIARVVGLTPVEVDRERIHELGTPSWMRTSPATPAWPGCSSSVVVPGWFLSWIPTSSHNCHTPAVASRSSGFVVPPPAPPPARDHPRNGLVRRALEAGMRPAPWIPPTPIRRSPLRRHAGPGDPVTPSCGARSPDDRDGAAHQAGRHPAASRPPRHADTPTAAPTTGPPGCQERAGLVALATAADAELAEHRIDGALIRVAPDGTLSWRSLHGAHPLQVLVGFVAPPEWAAIGVSNAGWAHPLDATGRPRRRPDAPSVQVTVLFSRSGVAAGVLRKAAGVSELPDPPEGVVADACRRALVLPTAPPPATTAELWALTWLDRIVEVAARAGGPAHLAGWPARGRPAPGGGPARPGRPTRRRWPRRPWRWPRRGRGPGCGPSRRSSTCRAAGGRPTSPRGWTTACGPGGCSPASPGGPMPWPRSMPSSRPPWPSP